METVREVSVLIIDDHADVRELLAQRLSSCPPLRVVAHTGDPLLGTELAWFWEPDIILVDLKAAGPHGPKVCRQIARASPSSRLVVFTSYFLDREEQAYLKAGASRCLLKGMSLRALSEELCRLVGQAAA